MDTSSPPRIPCVSSLRAGRCVRCASRVWSLRPSPRCPALTPPLWTALSFRPSLRSLFVSLPLSHCLCVTPSSRVSLPLSPLSPSQGLLRASLWGFLFALCVCVPVLTVFPLGRLPSGQCCRARPHHLWAERGWGLPQGTCPKSTSGSLTSRGALWWPLSPQLCPCFQPNCFIGWVSLCGGPPISPILYKHLVSFCPTLL